MDAFRTRRSLILCMLGAASAASLLFGNPGAASARAPEDGSGRLRVTLVGSPRETRPDGTVTYAVTLTNMRSRPTKTVLLTVVGANAAVESITATGVLCSQEAAFDVFCGAKRLAAPGQATVQISARATSLAPIGVTATAWSTTRKAAQRQASATVVTSAVAPDVVHAVGSRLMGGRPDVPQQFRIDAISTARGQDAIGTFSLKSQWPGGSEELSGR